MQWTLRASSHKKWNNKKKENYSVSLPHQVGREPFLNDYNQILIKAIMKKLTFLAASAAIMLAACLYFAANTQTKEA